MTSEQPVPYAEQTYPDDVTPDTLLRDFRGMPLLLLIAVMLVLHVMVIVVFSFGYLKTQLVGSETVDMTKEQRLNVAFDEASSVIREIAERHDLTPQELGARMAEGEKPPAPATSPKSTGPKAEQPAADSPGPDGERPKSEFEKKYDETADGPDMPGLVPDEEEDLFD